MSAVSHGGRGSPTVKSGRLKNRKQAQPRKLTMEDHICKEQKCTDVSCSKAYFAKSVYLIFFDFSFSKMYCIIIVNFKFKNAKHTFMLKSLQSYTSGPDGYSMGTAG